MPRRALAALLALPLALAPLAPRDAWARSERTFAYPLDQVWAPTIRFLRVDERVRVVEKDERAGYALFELVEDRRTFRGSIEIFPVTRGGRADVRFVVQIEDRPSYVELAMLERLERKLRAELGAPAPAPSRPAKDPAPTGDAPTPTPSPAP